MLVSDKRIAIVGSADGWQLHRKFRFTHKIWCCFSTIRLIQSRIDIAFGGDPLELMQKFKTSIERHRLLTMTISVEEINKRKIPVFLPRTYHNIPTSMKYPLREIVAKFGITYFSNTICYMIAYALYKGVKSIDFFGVRMAYGSEYTNEKAGLEFWIGYAMGKGVKIKVHGESALLKTKTGRLYGYGCNEQLNDGIIEV